MISFSANHKRVIFPLYQSEANKVWIGMDCRIAQDIVE